MRIGCSWCPCQSSLSPLYPGLRRRPPQLSKSLRSRNRCDRIPVSWSSWYHDSRGGVWRILARVQVWVWFWFSVVVMGLQSPTFPSLLWSSIIRISSLGVVGDVDGRYDGAWVTWCCHCCFSLQEKNSWRFPRLKKMSKKNTVVKDLFRCSTYSKWELTTHHQQTDSSEKKSPCQTLFPPQKSNPQTRTNVFSTFIGLWLVSLSR